MLNKPNTFETKRFVTSPLRCILLFLNHPLSKTVFRMSLWLFFLHSWHFKHEKWMFNHIISVMHVTPLFSWLSVHFHFSFPQGITLPATFSWGERSLTLRTLRDTSLEKTWTWISLETGQCRWGQADRRAICTEVVSASGTSSHSPRVLCTSSHTWRLHLTSLWKPWGAWWTSGRILCGWSGTSSQPRSSECSVWRVASLCLLIQTCLSYIQVQRWFWRPGGGGWKAKGPVRRGVHLWRRRSGGHHPLLPGLWGVLQRDGSVGKLFF